MFIVYMLPYYIEYFIMFQSETLSLVHASAKNREHSLHEGGGRLNQGDV